MDDREEAPSSSQAAGSPPHELPESLVERLARQLSQAALVAMLLVIGVEVFSRAVFNHSFQIADEVGGYLLVALAFFSLAVCQAHNSFHEVEFIQNRMPARVRAIVRVAFDLVMLAVVAILLWQMVRYEISLWNGGSRAGTYLRTPLWIPALPMALGMAAFAFTLLRTFVADLRWLAVGVRTERGGRDGA